MPATLLTVAGIWRADPDSVLFQPEKAISADEWAALVAKLPESSRAELAGRESPGTRAAAVRALASVFDFREAALP